MSDAKILADTFDCDMYPEDFEHEEVCHCGAFHDDLEYGENLCGACGLQIFDVFGPTYVASAPTANGEKK